MLLLLSRWLFALFVLSVGSKAHAEELPLTLLDDDAVRVDGSVGDWRGLRMRQLGNGANGSMKYLLGYDASALYLAAVVQDDVMVRTRAQSRAEDAIVITLAIPEQASMRVSELWLFAGIPGEQASVVMLSNAGGSLTPLHDALAIEGPSERGKGYVIEARIPWSRIAGGQQWQGGNAAISLHDVDRDGRTNDVASARFDAAHPEQLPRLAPSGLAAATLESFMASRGLSVTPRFNLRGDVAGDGRPEQVAVVDVNLVVLGPGYRNGTSYTFTQLPVVRSSDVISAELVDATGDGKQELLVKLRQQNGPGARDLLQLFEFGGEQPRAIFGIETRRQTAEGEVSVEVELVRGKRGQPPTIKVKVGSARGLSANNFRVPVEAGVEPMLLPWGDVGERAYQWDGVRFVASGDRAANGRRAQAAPVQAAPIAVSEAPEQPPAPPGIDALVDAFRSAQHIDRRLTPRLKRNANVAEDERAEQLMLFDKSLLVIGPGYRNGTGYFYYGLPVATAEDILRVFTADVTGDGRAEIFVRVRQWIGEVKRELLYVHQLDGNELRQLLVVEVRRAQGAQAVGNIVRLRFRGDHATLLVYPGHAEGWSQSNYPFVTDTTDGTEALLLPWSDGLVTYRFESGRLVH